MTPQFSDLDYLEQVYAAVFAKLKTARFFGGLALQLTNRSPVPPDAPPVASQPALFMTEGPFHAEQVAALGPQKWVFTAVVTVYFRTDATAPIAGQNPLPATIGNYLLWGLFLAFVADIPNEKQTLGGLVYDCWLEGEGSIEVLDNQAQMTLPVYILPGPVG